MRRSLPFLAVTRSVLAGTLLAAPVAAQAPRQLTAEDYARAERFLAAGVAPLVSGTSVRVTWLPDGRLWYRTNVGEGAAFWLVDPARGTRAPLFDHARLAAALAPVVGVRVDSARLPLPGLELDGDGRALVTTVRGRRVRCALTAYTCAPADSAAGRAGADASVSPDGRTAVFIRAHDLWARDLATGRETRLTTDGAKDFGYATNNAGWTHGDDPVVTWSPDSRRLATFQHDGRGVSEMTLAGTGVGAPKVETWKYPLPGDSVIFRIHRVVVELPQGDAPARVVRFQMPPDQHRSTVSDHVQCTGGTVCDLQWFPDGSQVAFVSSSRDHKRAWVRVADARTGAVRTVLEEQSATQIGDASLGERLWQVLPASNELLWWSQKDGWTHLYLHDLATGRLKRRITSGEGNVMDIVRVDERARQVYFLGQGRERGRDPYFQHLYRVGLDGGGPTLLTPESAHHVVTMAPDGRHFVDTYSTPDTPPVTVLRDASGRLVQTLERADVSRLVAAGWKPPIPIRAKARDGATDVHGLMFVPTTLDSTRKYPIINRIYPGPQAGSVGSRAWLAARADDQALAELGFIVVTIDGTGTPGRSKAFADAYYGRMGDNTLPDQIAAMRELAGRHRFINLDQVGIWGHSGGGFATAAAMFRHPEFFKVGISESGNHDQRNYEDDWGERYQGLLVRQGGTDSYAAEANQTHAAKLQGKLFLIHGMMDDNVPASNTLLVADALMAAGKDFDLLMLPQARHGFGQYSAYVTRRRWDYFVRHLQGAEPPPEYRIGGPRLVP
jgi:dipeptidyl aminopeptidase/acylaminoacyl peptidase